MLQKTFTHIPGIGEVYERLIWSKGINCWIDFFDLKERLPFSSEKKEIISNYIIRSQDALRRRDVSFFAQHLPKREWWRLCTKFGNKIAYLDIETTGLSPYYHDITLIGIYDGANNNIYIRGKNLDEFPHAILNFDILVTYNGITFDVPFVRYFFRNIRLPSVHIDLRYALRRLGYTGGLKAIEQKLGICRPEEVRGIDGYEAVRLWHQYCSGNERALELLIKYNAEDIGNLKILLEFFIDKMTSKLTYP